MEKIKLYNRDKIEIWLQESPSGFWTIECQNDFYKRYYRVIFDEDNKVQAIDPPGGPFISIGSVFGNKKVVSILESPIRIYLEDNDNSKEN